ncbi:TPA: polysaccharide biosynthesis C-terminal domain-containing protein [Corynebacterium aurimucosum]|nr:polysaccharide biosynthesis C-terminal domain-containing protein [Corynebacterium aurimucosum]
MSKGIELFKNTLILGLGSLSAQIVGFVLLPFYTHALAMDEFGFVDLMTVAFTLVVPVLTLQTHMASFRFLVDARSSVEEQRQIVTNTLILLALFLVLVVVGTAGLWLLFRPEHLLLVVGVGICMALLQNFGQLSRGLGFNLYYAVSNIITAVVTLVGALIFVGTFHWAVTGVFSALIIANGLGALYLVVALRMWTLVRPSLRSKDMCKSMLAYSVPLIPHGIAWWVNNVADRVLISFFLGTGANGIYAASAKFVTVLNAPNSMFMMSWAESASVNLKSPDRNEFFSNVANSALKLFGSGGLVLIAGMPLLFQLMISDEYSGGLVVVPMLVVGVVINVLAGIYDAVYVAKMQSRRVMVTSVLGAIVNLALNVLLIPIIGILGAATATTISFGVVAVVRAWDTRRVVSIRYNLRDVMALIIASVCVIVNFYLGTLFWNNVALAVAMIFAVILNRDYALMAWSKLRARNS